GSVTCPSDKNLKFSLTHYNHTCLGIVALQKKLDIHRALEYYIINDLSCLDTLGINASVPLQKRIW
ncbi:MAG TPA: hypothetical protein PK515_05690, partial [Candidatus Cloacimonas sp.]|nr:hypothetical protein [Candidatus Cloacimonas sp.]